MGEHNRRRALADLVGLDAWKGVPDKQGRFNLHVDVAFGTSRVGGGIDDQVRFRLSLKHAEIVVVVPDTEPAMVDKASVKRDDATPAKVKATQTKQSSAMRRGDAKIGLGVSTKGIKGEVQLGAAADASVARAAITTITRQGSVLIVGQSKTVDGDYRWVVTPAVDGQSLDGHPWDAAKAPRMKVKDTRKDRARGIEPTVRIQVRCLREDLEISNIVLKDSRAWERLIRSPTHRNRVAAAEAVIRDRLMKAGLIHGALDEPFAEMCLAEVSVGEDA